MSPWALTLMHKISVNRHCCVGFMFPWALTLMHNTSVSRHSCVGRSGHYVLPQVMVQPPLPSLKLAHSIFTVARFKS